jgi:hypothetical protein
MIAEKLIKRGAEGILYIGPPPKPEVKKNYGLKEIPKKGKKTWRKK